MRLLWLAFISSPRGFRESYNGAHEPGVNMLLPLFILVFGAFVCRLYF